MAFQTLRSLNLKDKTVLLRADLNVPTENKKVTDSTRIDRLYPTIKYLQEQNAKIVVLSHFGRPKGKPDAELSLQFLKPALEKSWKSTIHFAPDCVGSIAKKTISTAKSREIILLENVRFHEGETKNDIGFAQQLAELGDIYINDAFSAAHRSHASTDALAGLLPNGAGLLMETELNALEGALINPLRPVLALTGGSKISTKLDILTNLVEKVDFLVLSGGMANTFLFAQGYSMGKSLYEAEMANTALQILKKADQVRCEIILPTDVVVAKELKENVEHQTVSIRDIPDDWMAIDAGPNTVAYITDKVNASKTIVWNGPVGVFEVKPFDHGTNQVALAVAAHTTNGECTSIAGGGDTVFALENAGVIGAFSYVSTAGGAFLEWLEGKTLPGIAALSSNEPKLKEKVGS
ncbi:MAG: phosphoglycerate kinase [Alphaproteobacteria bacterium]|nr:phosphoglycerate kinase [Alphaproteobacteria bacterium]